MTRSQIPLRRRVTIASTLLGLVLSVLFATAAIVITEDYEYILVNEILSGQAEDYSTRLSTRRDAGLPRSHRLSGYLVGAPGLRAGYAALPPGIHEDPSNEDTHIGVFDTPSGRLVFVVDLSDIEQLERHLAWLLVGIVVLGTTTAGWIGWLLSGRALSPVGHLAAAVDAMPARPQRTSLAAAFSQDELGRLAGAVDAYQSRLVEADERERAFFADASHELRTPIAVVQGVAEVLLDEPGAGAAMRQRLLRLDRGVHELTDLLDVLLGLARRSELLVERIDARALLQECCRDVLSTRPGLQASIDAEGELCLPRRESVLLLRSTIRRALPIDTTGSVRLTLRAPWMEIELEGAAKTGSGHTRESARGDAGHGLTLISRLALQLGWVLEHPDGGGARIRLPDSAFSRAR